MIRALFAALAFIALSLAAQADERIETFVSDVSIAISGELTVIETITVYSEGLNIRRGILRDFPTKYTDKRGYRVDVPFTVISVRRDGRPEPWFTEAIANGVRITIGNRNVLLPLGHHTYEITYKTDKQLGFFEGFDELYWNVTGNLWAFPILRAEAIVHLPPGASIIQSAAYTGPQGAKGKDYRETETHGRTYRAETTKRLEAAEGFTIAVGFTKGIVPAPPPPPDTSRQAYEAMGAGLLSLLAYYLIAWFFVGRDPPARAIIPLFAPPKGLGAAGVRQVWKRGFDWKSFGAGVIGLAAQGALKIKGGKSYFIERIIRSPAGLTPSERALYEALPDRSLNVHWSSGDKLVKMREELRLAAEKEVGGTIYHRNRKWFWLGLVISFAAVLPSLLFMTPNEAVGGITLTFVFGGAWLLLAWLIFVSAKGFMRFKWLGKTFTALVLILVVPLFLIVSLWPLDLLAMAEGYVLPAFAAVLAAMVAMHIAFFRWLGAYTETGRRLMDEVEGFRMYLAAAEEDRLNVMNPPEKTPELFEKFLPFAFALDCENEWSAKFASVLAAAAIPGPRYIEGEWKSTGFNDFSRSLDSNRIAPSTSASSHTTSSSSYSPGSSSGSSGGGSSGGGGGGGGGSGW